MRSQGVSEYRLDELGRLKTDFGGFKTWTPKLWGFDSHLKLDFEVLDENLEKNTKHFTPCLRFIDEGNENACNIMPGIDKSVLLDRYGSESNWREAVKNSARRVKVMDNGEEIMDCTWSEMKLRCKLWKEQNNSNLLYNTCEGSNIPEDETLTQP